MRSLGQASPGPESPGSTEAHRERMLFQSARIQEVNQHLACLMASDMSFPLSMNLAVRGPQERERGEDRQLARLRDQNRWGRAGAGLGEDRGQVSVRTGVRSITLRITVTRGNLPGTCNPI